MLSALECFELAYKEFRNRLNQASLEEHDQCCYKAIDYLVKARELDANSTAKSYFYCGAFFETINEFGKAIENYSKSVENSKSPQAYFNRGTLYQKQGIYGAAIADFNEVIKLKPKDADVYNNRALAYETSKKPELAIGNYCQAISLNPKEPAFYCNRGSVHQENQNYKAAKKDFTKAIELYQNIVNHHFATTSKQHILVSELFKQKNQNEAYLFSQEQEAMDIDNDSYQKIGNIFNQIDAINQIIANIYPQLALTYFKRSIVYYRLKRFPAAKEDYEKAVELDPELKDAYIKTSYQPAPLLNNANSHIFSAVPTRQSSEKNESPGKKMRVNESYITHPAGKCP